MDAGDHDKHRIVLESLDLEQSLVDRGYGLFPSREKARFFDPASACIGDLHGVFERGGVLQRNPNLPQAAVGCKYHALPIGRVNRVVHSGRKFGGRQSDQSIAVGGGFLSAWGSGEAAVGADNLGVDPTAVRAGEEGNDACNIIRLAEALQWSHLADGGNLLFGLVG